MDTERFKPFLPDYLATVSRKQRNGQWICPFCGSGTGRNKTAALSVYGNQRYKCFSCQESGDIFTMVGKLERLDFKDAVRRVAEMYGEEEPRPPEKRAEIMPKKGAFDAYIAQCQKHSTGYFKDRGLTEEDVERFGLGYDMQREAIVIPYSHSNSYFLRRSVAIKSFYKPPSDVAGAEPIYNVGALTSDKPCFVCESPLDAISVMSASEYNAIAIGGTGVRKLIDYIDRKGTLAPIVISLDDDEGKARNAGKESTRELAGELAVRFVPFAIARYSKDKYPEDKRKDANDMLISNKEAFSEDIKENALMASKVREVYANCNWG